jgi:hypothetical protein
MQSSAGAHFMLQLRSVGCPVHVPSMRLAESHHSYVQEHSCQSSLSVSDPEMLKCQDAVQVQV